MRLTLPRLDFCFTGIRLKTAAALFSFGLAMCLATLFIVRQGVLYQFEQIEKDLVREDIQRVKNYIQMRQQTLLATSKDYGHWDDTYRFMGGEYPGFAEHHLGTADMDSLGVDLVVLLRTDGTAAAFYSADRRGGGTRRSDQPHPATIQLLSRAIRDGRCAVHEEGACISGILLLPQGPMLIAASDILDNAGKKAPRGHLILGRWMEGDFNDRLADATVIQVSLSGLERPARAEPDTPPFDFQINPGESVLTASSILPDVFGHPGVLLKIQKPMRNHELGRRMVEGLGLATIVITLAGIVFLIMTLDHLVTGRLSRLRDALDRVSRDRTPFPVEQFPLRDEIGQLAGMMKKVFERIAASELELKASEAKYRAVVEQSPEGIFLAREEDWLLADTNPAFRRLLSLPAEGAAGGRLEEVAPAPTPPWPEIRETYRAAGRATFHLRHPDRSTLRVEVVRILVAGRDMICGMVEDEGESERLQERLRRAEIAESVGQLAGGVAHDFNNLLTVIIGSIEILRSGGSLPPEDQESLETIRRAAQSASDLTRKLLLYGRRGPIQRRPVDLARLASGLRPMLARIVPGNIQLETEVPAAPVPALVDASAVEQAVINLILNARDAMPNGGTIRLAVRAADDGTALLEVRDTGHGMTEEVRARIFEPFFTTKEVGRGSGLGLSMVFGIVSQHEGRIEVQSTPGQGACFQLFFPRAVLPEPGEARTDRIRSTLGGGRILVVEDERIIRQLLARALEQAGFQVQTAANGVEALAWAREPGHDLDFLVTDVVMPGGISGYEVAAAFAARFPHAGLVLMSGYNAEMGEARRDWQAGLDGSRIRFMQKPFETADLIRELATLRPASGR